MEKTHKRHEEKERIDKEVRAMMEIGRDDRIREYEEIGRKNEIRKMKKAIRKFVRHMNQEAKRLEAEAKRLEAKGVSMQIEDYLDTDEASTSEARGCATHYLNESGERKEIEDPRAREEMLAESDREEFNVFICAVKFLQ